MMHNNTIEAGQCSWLPAPTTALPSESDWDISSSALEPLVSLLLCKPKDFQANQTMMLFSKFLVFLDENGPPKNINTRIKAFCGVSFLSVTIRGALYMLIYFSEYHVI